MSILAELLLEEYERCLRKKEAWKSALKDDSAKEQWPSYRKALKETEKDIWMLRRTLGFRLLREKWRKKHDQIQQ